LYEEFYGFKIKPFSKTPDPRFLYRGRAHAEAFARLELAVEEREIALLTGEIGCGKTTISRALVDSIEDTCKPVVIINPRLTPTQLLRTIAKRLEIENIRNNKNDLLEQLSERIFQLDEQGINTVIILDEAQLIPSRESFEELRLLTNFQLDERNLLTLILIGQPELKEKLKHKSCAALLQRIGVKYHIKPLDQSEVKEYLNFRMSVAGRQEGLFTDSAVELIYNLSKGVPREINTIANYALLEGFGREAKEIDADIIRDIASDLEFELV
jgi:type II secretory pathway predicted ATPase ExeA